MEQQEVFFNNIELFIEWSKTATPDNILQVTAALLNAAAIHEDSNILQKCLSINSNLSSNIYLQDDYNNNSPLHWAVMNATTSECLILLLQTDINLNLQNNNNETAFAIACKTMYFSTADLNITSRNQYLLASMGCTLILPNSDNYIILPDTINHAQRALTNLTLMESTLDEFFQPQIMNLICTFIIHKSNLILLTHINQQNE